ncbi:MAG: macro domain-containing protein [Hyphomonadaceae bacterium]
MRVKMDIVVGYIELMKTHAIVNAANGALFRGTGVDGAIRHAAGPELDALLATYPGLGEGQALLTPGFNLKARYVIHTVAPIWFASDEEEKKIALLTQCYRSCLETARGAECKSIAFPAIGTGNFGWPRELGAEIAIKAARAHGEGLRVTFCCFTKDDAAVYKKALAAKG